MSTAPSWPAPDPQNPETQARKRVATALKDLGFPVHDTPPETIVPPCVLILPAKTAWIGRRGQVALIIRCIANGTGPGLPALTRLEDMVQRTRDALRFTGLGPDDTDGPAVGADRLTADIPLTIRMKPVL